MSRIVAAFARLSKGRYLVLRNLGRTLEFGIPAGQSLTPTQPFADSRHEDSLLSRGPFAFLQFNLPTIR